MIVKSDRSGLHFGSDTCLLYNLGQVSFPGIQDDLVRFKCDYIHKILSLLSGTEWQTLFLIYFAFVPCLACSEFTIKMKCETTLGALEITQICSQETIKKRAERKLTFHYQHFLSSRCGGFLLLSPSIINTIFQNVLIFPSEI